MLKEKSLRLSAEHFQMDHEGWERDKNGRKAGKGRFKVKIYPNTPRGKDLLQYTQSKDLFKHTKAHCKKEKQKEKKIQMLESECLPAGG